MHVVAAARPQHDGPDDRTGGNEAREEEEPSPRPAERREHERRDGPADRHGRLPHSEREPALAGAEPAHHRPAAPRLDAAAGGPDEPQQHHERGESRRVGRPDEEAGAEQQAGRERPALAEPVDREPPRQERDRQPDPLGGQDDAELRQRQVVLVAKRRRQHRDAERDRGEARLRGRARGEHGPAVAHAPRARRDSTAASRCRRSRSSSPGRARASRSPARARSRTACSRRTGCPGTR